MSLTTASLNHHIWTSRVRWGGDRSRYEIKKKRYEEKKKLESPGPPEPNSGKDQGEKDLSGEVFDDPKGSFKKVDHHSGGGVQGSNWGKISK